MGSKPALPKAFDLGNPRIMTSTEALEIEEIPADLLIVGGGYIGMELGTVYAALGSKVVVVEALESILAGADPDLEQPSSSSVKKLEETPMLVHLGRTSQGSASATVAELAQWELAAERSSPPRPPGHPSLARESTLRTHLPGSGRSVA